MIIYNKKRLLHAPTHILPPTVNRSRTKIKDKILSSENKIFLQSLNLKLK